MKTRSIFFFLLNTLRKIKRFRNQLYYCVQLQPRCLICEICREFQSVEYDLYENMFCLDFLGRVHSYLHDYLEKIFLSKRCLCLILNNEYSSRTGLQVKTIGFLSKMQLLIKKITTLTLLKYQLSCTI